MPEQTRAHVCDDGGRKPRVPSLVPDGDDRGEDAGYREHAEDYVERLEILFTERVVDQEFEAERHDDVEQRLDHHADADECHHFLVVGQERPDERIDRRHRAGGFLGGKDDEILVVLVVDLKFVVPLFVIGGSRLVVRSAIRRNSPRRELLFELGRSGIIR